MAEQEHTPRQLSRSEAASSRCVLSKESSALDGTEGVDRLSLERWAVREGREGVRRPRRPRNIYTFVLPRSP
jgi:hypothetical protein